MKIIVAGSRDFKKEEKVFEAIEAAPFEITEIVSGRAEGVDEIAEEWAQENEIPVQPFPVKEEDIDEYGDYAPIKRNQEMADYADGLIAVWDGISNGTSAMIDIAEKEGLPVYTEIVGSGTSLDDFAD